MKNSRWFSSSDQGFGRLLILPFALTSKHIHSFAACIVHFLRTFIRRQTIILFSCQLRRWKPFKSVSKETGNWLLVLAITLSFVFGVPPVEAEESRFRHIPLGLDNSTLSGLPSCGDAINNGMSEGAECLAGWSVNHLLIDAATDYASKKGQEVFGKNFRIVNSLSYSPEGNGLAGGLDVVLPLPIASSDAAASQFNAFFLQQGVTRWVDDFGSVRNDVRFGAVRRFDMMDFGAASGVFGVSAFVQQNLEYQHTRLVAGADYTGKWGQGSLNIFMPTSGWRANYIGYEERALAGIELGLKLDITTTMSMNAAIGQWENDKDLDAWSTNGRIALAWRPHTWFNFDVGWNGLDSDGATPTIRLAFSMPLGKSYKPPQWEGLGFFGGGPKQFAIDPWSPVDNINVIQVARHDEVLRRAVASERLVSEATVQFLQDSATSGDQISIEVLLPAVASRDMHLVLTLGPGSGDKPAVPGVDYVDEPVAVTIREGASRAVVTIQLPLHAELNESRSLSVKLSLAS